MMVQKNTPRIYSLDLLRGVVMILMALDHVRYFFHTDAQIHNPEDLSATTPILFFTRWVTHFCAPVFIFLAGISAFLFAERKGKEQAFRFLISRGLFLIFLELTLFRLAWDGSFEGMHFNLLVIWAIGVSMIFLAIAIKLLNDKMLLIIGAIIIFGHNLLDGIKANPETFFGKIWILLHESNFFKLTDSISVFVLYPLLPYFGAILLGWCCGKIFSDRFDKMKRRNILLWMGVGGIILFILLRFSNLYGDPDQWSVQKNPAYTFFSFFKTTKYPTSLLFLLMTIAPALLLLYAADRKVPKLFFPLIETGQAPMFFYIIHLFLIRWIAQIGGGFNTYTLAGVYAAWIIVIIILYILCRYYRKYKFTHRGKRWLTYL